MRKVILLLLFTLPIFAMKTTYYYVQDELKKFSGACYEVDEKTQGQVYSRKVALSKCVTKNTTHVWSPSEKPKYPGHGTCFQVDSQTGGEKFSRKAKPSKCRPKKSKFILDQSKSVNGKCFLIDEESEGQLYRIKAPISKCEKVKVEFKWVLKEDGVTGSCISSSGEYQNTVPARRCRPKKVKYTIVEGNCYEYHPDGWNLYSNKVSDRRCKKDIENYFWKKNESFIGGSCYQEMEDLNGLKSYKKSEDEKCKPDNTFFHFQPKGPGKGKCFEIDSETKGDQYFAIVKIEHCKPENTITDWMKIGLANGCFRIDAEKGEQGYYERLDRNKCPEKKVTTFFEADKSGWGGSCYINKLVLDSLQKTKVQTKKCRPSDDVMVYFWRDEGNYKGRCFEVDSKNGPESYSKTVRNNYCRPKAEDRDYVYVRNAQKEAEGTCYLVDKETKGTKFSVKVQANICRNRLKEKTINDEYDERERFKDSERPGRPGSWNRKINKEFREEQEEQRINDYKDAL